MRDPFNLERFVTAQKPVLDGVLAELRAGRKTGHWMWFVFPQMKGLGTSAQANYFGIGCLAEAAAYLEHRLLGPRLRECTQIVNQLPGVSAQEIFGEVDAMKFRSSMTLFAAADVVDVFSKALDKYFGGQADARTLTLLNARGQGASS